MSFTVFSTQRPAGVAGPQFLPYSHAGTHTCSGLHLPSFITSYFYYPPNVRLIHVLNNGPLNSRRDCPQTTPR